MNTAALFSQIETLPDSLKSIVAAFVQHLVAAESQLGEQPIKKNVPKFGSAKGMFIMTSAFDEPLEDFNEYMFP